MPKGKYPRIDVKTRFEQKVDVKESGCHLWKSTLHRDGYGKFWHIGGQIQAHRIAYMIYVGDIPEGQWVLHKCDNRLCVNPEHLYLGDAKQNTADMHNRGRAVGNTRYSIELINQAINLHGLGLSQQKIADTLGIHQTTISKYIRRAQNRLKEI